MINMSRLPQRHFKCLTTLDTNRSLCPHNHPLIGSHWKLRRKGAVARSHEFFIQFETERLKYCVKQFPLYPVQWFCTERLLDVKHRVILVYFEPKKIPCRKHDTWRKNGTSPLFVWTIIIWNFILLDFKWI